MRRLSCRIKDSSRVIFIDLRGHVCFRSGGRTIDLGDVRQAAYSNLEILRQDISNHVNTEKLKESCENQYVLTSMAAVTQCFAYREATALINLAQRTEKESLSVVVNPLDLVTENLIQELDYLPETKNITKELKDLSSRLKQKRVGKTSFQNKIRHIVGDIVHLVNP